MRGVDALAFVHWGTLHLGGVTGHWLMLVALWDAEFLLAQRSSRVTGAAERGAEFSLAERRFLLLLLLLDFLG